MRKFQLTAAIVLASFCASYAYVILCPNASGGDGPRHNCLRVEEVNINGEWVTATCDNVQVPEGWFAENCL